jgi:hypothetical protein
MGFALQAARGGILCAVILDYLPRPAGLGLRSAWKRFLAIASVIFFPSTTVAAKAECAKTAQVRIQEWPGDIYNIAPWVAEDWGNLSATDATLRRIVDVNAALLGVGTPKASIAGWNAYLVSLKQIPAPIPYDQVVWRSGRL